NLNQKTYDWTVRSVSALTSSLSVKIKLHHDGDQVEQGQIFLFNHFARFETFIPQFLMHQKSGAYCRSIAAGEFFRGNDTFANYLRSVGAVPHDMPELLPFLAKEILHGRKVIIFPEGGMVKDRRVLDDTGKYSIFSRTARERRKHHTGAAVLALTLNAFKIGIRALHADEDTVRLTQWVDRLNFENVEALIAAVEKPTLIIPANITFYPIRVRDNILRQGVELFTKGLSPRMAEELLIEGNILLRDTDMDVRLGDPVMPGKLWRLWEKKLLAPRVRKVNSMEELFELNFRRGSWIEKLSARAIGRTTLMLRDTYMYEMYKGVTLNLSHLASRMILMHVDRDQMTVNRELFHRMLYLAIKKSQAEPSLHLHRSLLDPETYAGVIKGRSKPLDQLITSAENTELVKQVDGHYVLMSKLKEEHGFDQVRIENPIAVYDNEMAPIQAARDVIEDAFNEAHDLSDHALALHRFDDEILSYQWDKRAYEKPKHAEINEQRTATEPGDPYLLTPEKSSGLGVVLVHGFLASPAELRGFADRLLAAGHPVIGVRLKGHGTSPWDLRDRTWKEWLSSVRRGFQIMSALADKVCVIGFSSGGALALHMAAENPDKLAGVCAVSAPLKFRNKNLVFVPLLHGVNKLTGWLPTMESVMPFIDNDSEHPEINYRHIPVRGLYELRHMVDEMEEVLPNIRCPAAVMQGDEDHVIEPESAKIIASLIGSENTELHMIESKRHGILNEDIGGTQDKVLAFVNSLIPNCSNNDP
ncbi:MAG: alpha/beta fold hydrolase, partial [Rhodospirillaceae bacterium]|nr:alpha/beta fold hydrolase [Rhodospirillaceae bacterium]